MRDGNYRTMKLVPSPDLSPKGTTYGCECLGRGEEFCLVAGGKAFSLPPPTTGVNRMMNFGERAGVRGQPNVPAS
jgi:hypothetical protein